VTFDYWYMFPISMLVATIAMASGVGGATFFAPILILGLRLPPDVAIGVGLITQMFGFGSGVWAYGRKRLIDYQLGFKITVIALPAALVGLALGSVTPAPALKALLGVALLGIAGAFLRAPALPPHPLPQPEPPWANPKAITNLTSANGEQFHYPTFSQRQAALPSGIGGLFLGMAAVGLGELVCYFLMERGHLPGKVAVATAVFVVALTSVPVAAGKLARFFYLGGDSLPLLLSLLIFTVPGVLLGAQVGSGVASRIPHRALERSLAVLFLLISVLTLIEAFSMTGC
jgi:uncharacterized protein